MKKKTKVAYWTPENEKEGAALLTYMYKDKCASKDKQIEELAIKTGLDCKQIL